MVRAKGPQKGRQKPCVWEMEHETELDNPTFTLSRIIFVYAGQATRLYGLKSVTKSLIRPALALHRPSMAGPPPSKLHMFRVCGSGAFRRFRSVSQGSQKKDHSIPARSLAFEQVPRLSLNPEEALSYLPAGCKVVTLFLARAAEICNCGLHACLCSQGGALQTS